MNKIILSYILLLAINPFYWIIFKLIIEGKITIIKITKLIFFTILLQLLCYPYTEILSLGSKEEQSMLLNLGVGVFINLVLILKSLIFIKQ